MSKKALLAWSRAPGDKAQRAMRVEEVKSTRLQSKDERLEPGIWRAAEWPGQDSGAIREMITCSLDWDWGARIAPPSKDLWKFQLYWDIIEMSDVSLAALSFGVLCPLPFLSCPLSYPGAACIYSRVMLCYSFSPTYLWYFVFLKLLGPIPRTLGNKP